MGGGGDLEEDAIVTAFIKQDKVPWYKKPNLRTLYFIMFPTCIGIEITSGYDSSMMNGLQTVQVWDDFFGRPRDYILGLMTSAYSLGAFLSLPFVPFIVDRLGRRKAIVLGSCIMIIGAGIQTASINYPMFVISRCILGFGIPMCIISGAALIGELSYPKERPMIGALFNASWFMGSILAAGVTFGTYTIKTHWSWRIPSILQMAPSILQIVTMPLLPESPRWLISKGREEEAFKILAKYHAEGDENSEFVKTEFAQIQATIAIELENSKRSWKEMFATYGMRRRMLIASFLGLFTQWSGNGMISYYLKRILEDVGVTSNRTVNQVNVSLQCWNLLNGTTIALIVPRFPRRRMYLLCTVCLLSVYTAWTICAARYTIGGDKNASKGVLALIFCYQPAYNIGYNALTYTFLPELFPFHVRARGMTTFQIFGRLASFFNQYVNPIGIARAGWKYYIAYVCWLAFEVVFVYFIFPETYGRTLEELAFLYEGDEVKARQLEETNRELNLAGVHHTDEKHKAVASEDVKKTDTDHVEKV